MSKLRFSMILFPFLVAMLPLVSKMVIRLDNPPHQLAAYYNSQGFDVASYRPGEYLDLVVDDAQYQIFQAENPSWYITQTEARLKEALTPQRDIPGYMNYDQMLNQLMTLQAQYPFLMQMSTIGETWGSIYAPGYPPFYGNFDHSIWAVRVTANVDLAEEKPAFYFVGEHHAREPISTEVCMAILNLLVEDYAINPQITQLLDNFEIWIVPLLNPNGHKIVIDQTDVWWRKNMRDNNNNQYFDTQTYYGFGADGVDINRNYGHHWGYVNATDDNTSPTYHGIAAFSEPESQAFATLLASRRFLAGISYHTYGQYVLYPYGYVSDIVAPDGAELYALASEVAGQILKYNTNNNHYDAMPSWQLYPVSGSLDDWAYGTHGIFAYTVEMAPEFIPQANQIQGIVVQNINGALQLLQRGSKKMLTGQITDAVTGEPIPARIWVQGIDGHPLGTAAMYANQANGSYYRLLPAGTHQIRCSHPGYETQIHQVQILPSAVTILDIQMQPSDIVDIDITVRDNSYQGIAGVKMVFAYNPEQPYFTDSEGKIRLEGFPSGLYEITICKEGYSSLRLWHQFDDGHHGFRLTHIAEFEDDFESGLMNWITYGNWGISSASAFSGTHSLADSPSGIYQNNVNSWCRLSQPIELRWAENADLQFMVKYIFSEDADYCLLQASTDLQNWQVMDSFTGSSDWTLKSYNLNSLLGQNVYFRFQMITDQWDVADGIFIDDFKIFTDSQFTPAADPVAAPVQSSCYPNPFSGNICIQAKGLKKNVDVAVYNLRGQRVWQKRVDSDKDGLLELWWDGKDAQGRDTATGIYMFRLSDAAGSASLGKILKIK